MGNDLWAIAGVFAVLLLPLLMAWWLLGREERRSRGQVQPKRRAKIRPPSDPLPPRDPPPC